MIIKKELVNNYLVKGISGVFIVRFLGLLLSFITSIVLARVLGAEEYGTYSFAIETMMFISIPVTLGLPNLLTREVAKYKKLEKYDHIIGILRWSGFLVFKLSLIITIISVVGIFLFPDLETKYKALLFAVPIVLLQGLGQVRMGCLRGLKKVVKSEAPDVLLRQLFFVMLISAFFLVTQKEVTYKTAILIFLLSLFLSFVIGYYWLFSGFLRKYISVKPHYNRREWFKEALPFFMLGGVAIMNSKLSMVIIGLFRPVAEVGFYKIAVFGSTMVAFLLKAVNMTLGPVISEMYVSDQKKKLQHILKITVRLIFAAAAATTAVFVILGKFLIINVYGIEYAPAYMPLVILSAGQLFNAGAGSVAYVLNMTGNQRDTLKGQTVSAVTSIILCLCLIPFFGINGAAAATSCSLVVWNIILLSFLKKRTTLKTSIF